MYHLTPLWAAVVVRCRQWGLDGAPITHGCGAKIEIKINTKQALLRKKQKIFFVH